MSGQAQRGKNIEPLFLLSDHCLGLYPCGMGGFRSWFQQKNYNVRYLSCALSYRKIRC